MNLTPFLCILAHKAKVLILILLVDLSEEQNFISVPSCATSAIKSKLYKNKHNWQIKMIMILILSSKVRMRC